MRGDSKYFRVSHFFFKISFLPCLKIISIMTKVNGKANTSQNEQFPRDSNKKISSEFNFSSCIDHEEIFFCIFYSSILMTFFWFENKRKTATIFFLETALLFRFLLSQ